MHAAAPWWLLESTTFRLSLMPPLLPSPPPLSHRSLRFPPCSPQVADGMQYIHSKSIIHGDLKPENVLLKHDSAGPPPCVVSKITDFGLCTTMDPGKTHISGFTNGTPFYMAPEIALSRKGTPSSDVYSFGEHWGAGHGQLSMDWGREWAWGQGMGVAA